MSQGVSYAHAYNAQRSATARRNLFPTTTRFAGGANANVPFASLTSFLGSSRKSVGKLVLTGTTGVIVPLLSDC